MLGRTRTVRVTTRSLAVILSLTPGLGPDVVSSGRVEAQETSGSTEAAVAGAAMGLYAGAALGGLASLVPCNQTMAGISCVRTVTVLGAGIGLASGVTLGREDSDAIWTAYRRAGVGFLAGSAVVLALKPFVDRWSWADVAAGGVIGSSIGAGGSGAWIGLVAGMGVGFGLWQLVPSMELPDAIGVGLIGMAVGGFTAWIVRAVDAGDSPPSDVPVLQFDVAVPW
ncbi:MAG: hypothetical protein M8861_11715 [marine benthic group bacterium]|nr:hypothetical protein [Gemmatimonadota bacterium]